MTNVEISIARQASPELLRAVAALLPQLSSSAHKPTAAELQAIVEYPGISIFIASDDGMIVGMLTLVLVPITTGLRAHIEDAVVATTHRRQGIARALTKAAIEHAIRSGARTIDLTSRPSRIEAIRLYEGLGFQRRDTNVFRLQCDRDSEFERSS